jgi:hypothetical protein
MKEKRCKCLGCQSTSHDRLPNGRPGECITRNSDAPYLWDRGVCPACLSLARLKTTETESASLPHKHFFGNGISIDEIVDTIQKMSIAALYAKDEARQEVKHGSLCVIIYERRHSAALGD